LGLSVEEDPDVDFKELGDNSFGNKKEDFPWQSPATVAHSWGFHATDSEWKSTTGLLKSLINNVSLNGNLLLNIGPRANGDVPFEISQRMLEMGSWLEINGESIYGTGSFNLSKDLHDWGRITCKQEGNKFKLYLHVFNWPLNKELDLTGIKSKPEKIYLLADKQKSPVLFTHNEVITKISLPKLQPDPFVSVIVVEYTKKPEIVEGLVAKSTSGGYSLTPVNQAATDQSINIQRKQKSGTVPEHAIINNSQTLKWKIYVDEPGEKQVDVSYSFQSQTTNTNLKIKAAGSELILKAEETGKTIGEPNQNWIIDNFKSASAGKIYFQKAGFYDVETEVIPAKNEELKFQWIWIE
jgi:alpha-L-fucosidase